MLKESIEIKNTINYALRNKGFTKAIPIFFVGRCKREGFKIILEYPDEDIKHHYMRLHSEYKKIERGLYSGLFLNKHWHIIGDKFLESKAGSNVPETIKLLYLQDVPFYMQEFITIIRELYKTNPIYVEDRIPFYFRVVIHTNLASRQSKKQYLNGIALRLTIPLENKELKFIIKNRELTVEESLEEIYKIAKTKFETPYSFCLNCGREIAKSSKFCNQGKNKGRDKKNRNYCRNNFYYSLKRVQNEKNKGEEIKNYYKEILSIIEYAPFTAHKIFKINNKDLFERRKYKMSKSSKLDKEV